jgi:threonine/homoserine/homoserine lactone efflux protein
MGIMTFLPVIKKNYNNDFTITEESKKSNLSLIAGGFVMSVSNPYFLLWWLVIGAGYLFASLKLGTIGVILFFIGHILADMVWYVFISQCVSKSKKFLSGKYYLSIIIICSILIIIIGAVFFIKGIILL